MSQPWFRLYYEALDDPKIGRLTDAQFRVWVSVLMVQCAAGTDDGWTGLTAVGVGWRMRRDCEAELRALEEFGLVGIDEDGIVFVPAWSTRQFKSDNSTERVKRFRERQRALLEQNETVSGNVTKRLGETPPETDTETDSEQSPPTPRKRGSASAARTEADAILDGIFDRFYTAYPRKKNRPAAHRAWRKQVRSEADAQQVSRGLKREMAEWQREGRPEDKIPYPATWLNAQDWRQAGDAQSALKLDVNPHRHLRVWEIPIPEDVRWECEGRLEAGQVYRDGMWVKFEDLDPEDPDYRKAVDRG